MKKVKPTLRSRATRLALTYKSDLDSFGLSRHQAKWVLIQYMADMYCKGYRAAKREESKAK